VLRWLPYLACLVAVWPLLAQGFPRGHDWSFELVRIAEYQAALGAGQLPPYWSQNLYSGYGSPIFLFYAPLFLFLSALVSWVLSVPAAATSVLIAFTLVSVWSVQKMMRAAGTSSTAARIAVYVYVLNPYLLGDKLIRNANAEFAGLCLAPFVLAGLFALGTQARRAFTWLSLGLALVILAHNLTALVVMGLVLVGACILYVPDQPRRTWLTLAAGIALGLGLAAFFWVPALALNSWMRPEQLLEGKFDFHGQFPTLRKLFGYERFFSVGILTPALLGVAAFVGLQSRGRDFASSRLLVTALIGALGFIFLLTPLSMPLWERMPFMPLFQFPWRMAGPLALMTALASGLSFAYMMRGRAPGLRAGIEVGLLVVCVANALPRIVAYQPLPPEIVERLTEALEPESVRNGTQSATVRDEYLPRSANALTWKRQRPMIGPVVSSTPAVSVGVRRDRGSQIELEIGAEVPASIRVARWNVPGWLLEINGEPAKLRGNPFGSIDIEVPQGKSQVSLRLRAPPVRRVGCLVSLVGLALVLSLMLRWPQLLWRGLGP
jgi:hypothetical protein